MAIIDQSFWQGKRVLVTGHTGFKGSWLCEWLLDLGTSVRGISLPPPTQPSLFTQLRLADRLDHQLADIRDPVLIRQLVMDWQPEVLFHLAAQPLVRRSYSEPVETWAVNVMGSIHVLEALRALESPYTGIFITTDKCYENREWLYGYRENDPLGGYDPYSSSKAGAELAIASWRRSFFQDTGGRIASGRAGNVIGGGDWAEDRIVPDAMGALGRGEPIPVRNPLATRPWQHVLEPLSGYLLLAQKLHQSNTDHCEKLCSAFNFGPALSSNRPVQDLVESILSHWPGSWLDKSDRQAVHEANLLNLVTDKAFHVLGWQSKWDFERTIKETVHWYREAQSSGYDSSYLQQLTLQQIHHYQQS